MLSRKIHVNLKMLGIPLYDVECELMLCEQLYAVKYRVEQQHGRALDNIQFWKNEVQPSSILRDLKASLGELVGIGYFNQDISDGDIPQLTLYYDFSPPENLCPILNAKF